MQHLDEILISTQELSLIVTENLNLSPSRIIHSLGSALDIRHAWVSLQRRDTRKLSRKFINQFRRVFQVREF